MEAWKCSLIVLGIVLCVAVQSAVGIKCYVCNSGSKYGGEECRDKQKLVNSNFLKECADEEAKDRVGNGTYQYCRVFSQDVRGDYRIIRQCASGGRVDKCIERTGTKGIKLSYCHCDFDGCNTASSISAPIAMVMAVVVAAWNFAQRT